MDPTFAEDLQAVHDTVYILHSTSPPWYQRPSFWISAAIAVFTGVYMVFTMRIFWKTEKQAEAAQDSAEASRDAADAAQRSNKIAERAQFYPVLEPHVNGKRLQGSENVFEAEVTLKELRGEMAMDVTGFCLVGNGPAVDEESFQDLEYQLEELDFGNIQGETSKETFQIGENIQDLYVLLQFSDALFNTYHRLTRYKVSFRELPRFDMANEWSAGLNAYPKCTVKSREDGISASPTSKEETDKPPEPIQVFNRVGRKK
jgi:hypothetical protein